VVVGARTLSLLGKKCPHLVSALHATQVLHSRRLSVSRMRENFTYGLMRGWWRRATGLLDRDTRPKGEKRPGVAGPHAAPRHCSTLQKRKVLEALPQRLRGAVHTAMNQAYATREAKRAPRLLTNLAHRLESAYPSAAASLREGREETLTVMRLHLPESLERVLSSTNLIENLFSRAREVARRVKRWQGGMMILRWTAAGVLEAERHFRQVAGYQSIPKLSVELRAHDAAINRRRGVDNRQFVVF
jgi:mutator family transposase